MKTKNQAEAAHLRIVKRVKEKTINAVQEHLAKKGIASFRSDGAAQYDLIIEEDGVLKKVRCQVGSLRGGEIDYWTANYFLSFDLVYVYVPKLNRIYRVPTPVAVASVGTLRFLPLRQRRYAFACDYESVAA